MKLGLIVVAAGALSASPVLAVNILVNPGFETGDLSPWYQGMDFGGLENWNATSADAHSGTFSATDSGNKRIQQDFAPTPTSDITELSFWLKNVFGSINAVDFIYDDGTTDEKLLDPNDGEWHFYDMTAHLLPGKNLQTLGIWGVLDQGESRTYVDDAKIDVVPGPGAAALVGVAGLVGMRRRR